MEDSPPENQKFRSGLFLTHWDDLLAPRETGIQKTRFLVRGNKDLDSCFRRNDESSLTQSDTILANCYIRKPPNDRLYNNIK